jgi:hypothetical protein
LAGAGLLLPANAGVTNTQARTVPSANFDTIFAIALT